MTNVARFLACLFFPVIVLCNKVYAQPAQVPDSGVVTYYHYASATVRNSKGTRAYVSEVAPIPFNSDYFPLKDANLKTKMKEQYLRFLQSNYGDSIKFRFYGFAMRRSKAAVEKARATEVTAMKQKKYTIVLVKDFRYD